MIKSLFPRKLNSDLKIQLSNLENALSYEDDIMSRDLSHEYLPMV